MANTVFSLYIASIAPLACHHGVPQQQYAADTQRLIALSPSNHTININRLQRRLSELYAWFCYNGLALNADKSDVIIVGTRQQVRTHTHLTHVAGAQVTVSYSTGILSVTIDKNLTFDNHVKSLCKYSYYHIRALCHIRPMLTEDMARSIACSLVNARLTMPTRYCSV